MDKTNTGGPAFPAMAKDMTLRDYFAGQALMGFAAAGRQATPKEWGATCYSLADAMLAAREAKQ